jgi:hypothetical protein
VKVTFRTQNHEFEQFFKTLGYFTYCKDIDGLMDAMHSPEQWRLFIDASKTSLTTVLLLHNGNKLPSIPVAYAPSTRETYTTMNDIQVEVDCKNYQWEVCDDFKVIAVLLGLQAITPNILVSCVSGIAAPETPTILGNIGHTDNR